MKIKLNSGHFPPSGQSTAQIYRGQKISSNKEYLPGEKLLHFCIFLGLLILLICFLLNIYISMNKRIEQVSNRLYSFESYFYDPFNPAWGNDIDKMKQKHIEAKFFVKTIVSDNYESEYYN